MSSAQNLPRKYLIVETVQEVIRESRTLVIQDEKGLNGVTNREHVELGFVLQNVKKPVYQATVIWTNILESDDETTAEHLIAICSHFKQSIFDSVLVLLFHG